MNPRTMIAVSSALLLASAGLVLYPAHPAHAGEAAPVPEMSKEILSQVYTVDKKYKSMMGPWSQASVNLLDSDQPELLWVTGYQAVMVGPDGEEPRSQEFMCHSNLDVDPYQHNRAMKARETISGRLFTLSQGQFDIEFPPGFGIPLVSTEPLSLTTQVLNLNDDQIDLQVRHKVTVHFVRDRDLKVPMKALLPGGVYGLKSLEDSPAHYGMSHNSDQQNGPGCLVGQNAAGHEYTDPLGQHFTGHWVVKPGREVNRTFVTRLLNLPYDTTVHYIAVHLHPFAESLELRDLTTGATVFKSHARPPEKGIGLQHVDYFSSVEGLPLYQSHDYELVSVYNNTSGEDQDSMAVMYMYLLDKRFSKPDLPAEAK